jgi:hypothetical protein
MAATTTTNASENIFSIAGQHSSASRFKLKSIGDDTTSTTSSSRLNHSIAYGKYFLDTFYFLLLLSS